MTDKRPKILIVCGKTGGHLFPGIAVAQALKQRHDGADVRFVETGNRFEVETIERFGFPHTTITALPVKGKSLIHLAAALAAIPLAMIQTLFLFFRFKPDFVLGTGAYTTFPVIATAALFRIPTGIQEQNSIPGLTNRILAGWAKVIFVSFRNTQILSENPKTIFTGNPVRREPDPRDTRLSGFDNHRLTLLVCGGSQGAKNINTAFLEAMGLTGNTGRYNIIHQTGQLDEKRVLAEYSAMGMHNVIAGAFFSNLAAYQKAADLIISRSGAGAISEITLAGKPSILVPYPYAANDHQTRNAQLLRNAAAALVIPDGELTGSALKTAIEHLDQNRETLDQMAAASGENASPHADDKIARTILTMIGGFKPGALPPIAGGIDGNTGDVLTCMHPHLWEPDLMAVSPSQAFCGQSVPSGKRE